MTGPTEPVLYWRQRCPYCVRLRWRLHQRGVSVREVNIWTDERARARLREITGGDETVPTLVVGDRSLVNPSYPDALAALRAEAPHSLDTASPTVPPPVAVLISAGFAACWVVLAVTRPTVTYHLGPVLVAAAAPVARRIGGGRLGWADAVATTAGSLSVALVTTAALAGLDRLAGPTVFGPGSALTESLAGAAFGALVGVLAAAVGRRRAADPGSRP